MFKFIKKLKLVFRSEEEILTELGKIYYNIKEDQPSLYLMSSDDKMEVLRKSYEFYHSMAFKNIFLDLRQFTINSTMQEAKNLNHFLCGKMTVYGINLVKERIETLANTYEQELRSSRQIFDEHSIL